MSTSISGRHVPLLAGFALCAEKLALTINATYPDVVMTVKRCGRHLWLIALIAGFATTLNIAQAQSATPGSIPVVGDNSIASAGKFPEQVRLPLELADLANVLVANTTKSGKEFASCLTRDVSSGKWNNSPPVEGKLRSAEGPAHCAVTADSHIFTPTRKKGKELNILPPPTSRTSQPMARNF